MIPLLPCRAPYAGYRTAISGGLHSPSSPAVSLSMAECFYTAKYRGEPRSMTTRRDLKKTLSGDNRGNPPPLPCPAAWQGVSVRKYRGRGLKSNLFRAVL